MKDLSNRSVNVICIIALLSLGGFAYCQHIGQQGWVDDDYIEVYGMLTPDKGFPATLRLCGQGHYTVARVLGLPLKLYVGRWLGPVGSHWLEAVIHLVCAVTFFALLRQLRFSHAVSLVSAVTFVISPWLSQAVIWWATMITPAAALCNLLACCIYVRLLDGLMRYRFAMPLICILVVAGLSLYELWLFVPLLFVLIAVYHECRLSSAPISLGSMRQYVTRAVIQLLPVFAVIFIWSIVYKMSMHSFGRAGAFSVGRMLITSVSIHARIYWWITRGATWRIPFQDGLHSFWPWFVLLIIGMLCLLQILARARSQDADGKSFVRLMTGVALAWGFYLSSKLVFVFMGGVAPHTRHNYGAAMGVGLLVGLSAEYALSAINRHSIIRASIIALLLMGTVALCITSAGIRSHYVEVSQAERYTIEELTPVARTMTAGQTLIVCGFSAKTTGEIPYFTTFSGDYLQRWLQKENPGVSCFVVPVVSVEGSDIAITAQLPGMAEGPFRFPRRNVRLFQWSNGKLLETTS